MNIKKNKLNLKQIELNLREKMKEENGIGELFQQMQALRVSIDTMIGGGLTANSAVNNPSDFYIDNRVSKLPYKKSDIYQALSVLSLYFKVLGYHSENVPYMPTFHHCGIF